jgi:predicted nucleotidyltransferase
MISKLKSSLSQHPDIVFAYLFGSQASGRATRMSDIDIAVYLHGSPDGEKRLEILGILIDALKSDRIDLVILNTAPLPLQFRVLKNNQLLVDNAPFIRHAFESKTIAMYLDFSIFEARILERRFFRDK